MIYKNGKLFGKVSVIDIIVVLAIIIAAAGIYVRFMGGPSKTVVQDSRFYYSFEVKNIREANLNGLRKCINGSFSLNEKISGDMGKLINLTESPARAYIEKVDGINVLAEIPDRYDAVLTFEISGKVNDRGFFSTSLEDISAGIYYNLKCKWSAIAGQVLKVWE